MIAQRSAPLVLAKDTFDYNMRYTVYFYEVAHTQATLQPKAQLPLRRQYRWWANSARMYQRCSDAPAATLKTSWERLTTRNGTIWDRLRPLLMFILLPLHPRRRLFAFKFLVVLFLFLPNPQKNQTLKKTKPQKKPNPNKSNLNNSMTTKWNWNWFLLLK